LLAPSSSPRLISRERGNVSTKGHKWFAAYYDRLMAWAEKGFLKHARSHIVSGARGRVLEVGAGTGANFPYYDASEARTVVATEPDPYMLKRARRRLYELRLPIDLQQALAEELPFADGSFDTVISTLVMCTVADLDGALREIRRVLKPSGQFRFYEHVRSTHSVGAFFQDLATPAWRWLGAGCSPNRDVAAAIRGAGFRLQEFRRLYPVPNIPPVSIARPHISGVALPS